MIDWDSFKQQLQTNPNRTLGFVLGLAGCLMLIWLVVVMQTSDPAANRPAELAGDGRLAGLRTSLQQPDSVRAESVSDTVSVTTGDTLAAPALASGTHAVAGHAKGDSSASDTATGTATGSTARADQLTGVLPTLLVMVVLIGGLWYWVRRKSSTPSSRSLADKEFFTLLGSGELYPGQQLALIEINCEYWVVGCGPQGPRVLHRFSPEEWDGPLPDRKGSGRGDWKSYLATALRSASSDPAGDGNGLTPDGQPGNGNGSADGANGNGSENGIHWDAEPANGPANGEARKLW